MPNFKEHLAVSLATTGVTYLAMCQYYQRKPTAEDALLCVGGGTIAGIVPDVLEPALHPHHRAACHSIAAAGLLAHAGTTLCPVTNEGWTEFAKIFFACLVVGYLTHLVLDGCTPRGLPLIT
jgi:inner membrane protein